MEMQDSVEASPPKRMAETDAKDSHLKFLNSCLLALKSQTLGSREK
jgi:hypothetical protein